MAAEKTVVMIEKSINICPFLPKVLLTLKDKRVSYELKLIDFSEKPCGEKC